MPDEFFTPLTEIHTGGAPVFPELLKRFPEKTHSIYGSSEAEPISHFPATELTPSIEEKIAMDTRHNAKVDYSQLENTEL
ncbi:MAG: hypothetical protein OSB05_05645 [Akkermansiaceae bacterium]|nr:hypothetical protein [Akkermansiaceae bacterium]